MRTTAVTSDDDVYTAKETISEETVMAALGFGKHTSVKRSVWERSSKPRALQCSALGHTASAGFVIGAVVVGNSRRLALFHLLFFCLLETPCHYVAWTGLKSQSPASVSCVTIPSANYPIFKRAANRGLERWLRG